MLGRLGLTLGSIGVDIFFIISGFLVTASILNRQSVIEFFWARVLRIFPALLIMLLLTVFVLGSFFTSLPKITYLTQPMTINYFLKGATLITGVDYILPGVFTGNRYAYYFNGSLWSLPLEIRLYLALAVIWVVVRAIKRSSLRLFQIAIVINFVAAFVVVALNNFEMHHIFPQRAHLMFFYGAAFYILKEHITLSRWCFWLLCFALLAAAITSKYVFVITYVLIVPYIVFYLAYIPSGFIRKYNQVGDYSYGVYIYAFPIQQSVEALVPGLSALSMLWISASITIFVAALSWHLLEQRALGLKVLYVGHTKNTLSRFFPYHVK